MPDSIKAAAVSLDQFISVAVAEKIGAMETAERFLRERAADAVPGDLLRYLDRVPEQTPSGDDRLG